MARNYSLPTIKALFAQATHCAYPSCPEPLVFEDPSRGIRSIAVQIAHIRSEKAKGPRYDAAYPKEKLNAEENLLLLCGKHHTPVDQNESVFTVDELLEWKAAQVAQGIGTVITDTDILNLVETLESTLSALYEALKVVLAIEIVGGRPEGDGIVTMPLEGLCSIEGLSSDLALIGVKVVNKGAAGVDIAGAGFQLDVGLEGENLSNWTLGGEWCQHGFPYRLEGRSTDYWYVAEATIRLTFGRFAKETGLMPRRLRPFAAIGDDTTDYGEWRGVRDLPFWTEEEVALFDALHGAVEEQSVSGGADPERAAE